MIAVRRSARRHAFAALLLAAFSVACAEGPAREGASPPGYTFGACADTAAGHEPGPVRSVYVPMRDGVRIAVDVVTPAGLPEGTRLPAILTMTRYWRAREGGGISPTTEFFVRRGYAYVYGDSRGTGASFGVWPYHRAPAETRDFGELVDWIVQQPWSDGNVGAWGSSYTANTADWTAAQNREAVKAIVPRFPDFDPYSDLYFPGGILQTGFSTAWSQRVKELDLNVPRGFPPAGVKPVDADTDGSMAAEAVRLRADVPDVYQGLRVVTYRDDVPDAWGASFEDWSIQFNRQAVERSGTAILTWGSWFDAGTADGVLRRFMTWDNPMRAVIGPWSHGGGRHASPYLPADTPTDPPFEAQLLEDLCFFRQHLEGRESGLAERALIYYTVGEEAWKVTDRWPPPGSVPRPWYFGAGGVLSPEPTSGGEDQFTVDFDVTTGVKNRWYTQLGGDNDVIYADLASRDASLLTYTSAPLETDLEITGHAVVTLHVRSTATDGAFFAYLEDVAPDGEVRYLTEGQLRALHRRVSNDEPPFRAPVPYHSFRRVDGEPLVPDELAELAFGLLPVSALVQRGHRIRVAIAGADRDSFVQIPEGEPPLITVASGAAYPSRIELPVIAR